MDSNMDNRPQAFNPVLPGWEYVPDAEPRVFAGRLHLYGSHDRFDGEDFCLNDYVGWSAPVDDLTDWCSDGVIYRAAQDPLNTDGQQHLFAPDAVQGPDGRYYLFYCLSRTSAVGVAVCDTPDGAFQFYGHVHHPNGALLGMTPGDPFCFDPGVLTDQGRIWLYVGFAASGMMRQIMQKTGLLCDGGYCLELEPDMLTVRSAPTLTVPAASVAAGTGFEGHAFFEASSPRKIGERYYLIYSSETSHELCYATANRPDSPFCYGGVIVSNGDVGFQENACATNYTGNNHGGMVQIGSQWYIFYHRQTNRRHFSRQCCAEPITVLPDGRIPQVKMTSAGLNGGPLAGRGRYEARIACCLSGAGGTYQYNREFHSDWQRHPYFTQDEPDGAERSCACIANLQNGSWAEFRSFCFESAQKITVDVRGDFTGVIEVTVPGLNEPAAAIAIQELSGTDWQPFSACLRIPDGVHALRLCCRGEGILDLRGFKLE